MEWRLVLLLAIGGALGSVARYSLTLVVNQTLVHANMRLLLGTIVVNVLGCFLMGCIFAWFSSKSEVGGHLRLFLSAGFLGAFTTFSAFSLESLQYLQRGDVQTALLNIGLSVFMGLLAIVIGFYLLRGLLH